MFSGSTPYFKRLDDGLVMKSISSMEDVERLAIFNGLVHQDESVARLTRALTFNHPYIIPDYFIFIEDESKKKIVSSICLIPWTLQFQGVELKSAEMGIVGTLKEYRKKGLIHELDVRFKELCERDNLLLSQIEGIPFFYKQFGYEYAIPLEMWYRLDLHLIPDTLSAEQQNFNFRKAEVKDIPTLMNLYDDMTNDLDIKSIRNNKIWNYLLDSALEFDPTQETWLVMDKKEEIRGYFRVTQEGFGKGLIVNESSNFNYDMTCAVIKKLKNLSVECKKPYLRMNIHEDSSLVKIALSMGGNELDHYAWQIRIVDLKKFAEKLIPVLELRLKDSLFYGLSESFFIDMYRKTLELRIVDGNIEEISLVPSRGEESHVRIPPNLITPFILGYRTREELLQFNHDFSYIKKWEYLIDVLFPRMKSFFYTIF